MQIYWERNPIILGGENCRVQIDETKLSHNVRAHRGRALEHIDWTITMADTFSVPAKSFAKILLNRGAETLITIIKNVVSSGTTIVTDEWKGYNELSRSREFIHEKITHKYNFVDPITGVHTQNVESLNNKIKLDIKQKRK